MAYTPFGVHCVINTTQERHLKTCRGASCCKSCTSLSQACENKLTRTRQVTFWLQGGVVSMARHICRFDCIITTGRTLTSTPMQFIACDALQRQDELMLSEAFQEGVGQVRRNLGAGTPMQIINFDWHGMIRDLKEKETVRCLWEHLQGLLPRTDLSVGTMLPRPTQAPADRPQRFAYIFLLIDLPMQHVFPVRKMFTHRPFYAACIPCRCQQGWAAYPYWHVSKARQHCAGSVNSVLQYVAVGLPALHKVLGLHGIMVIPDVLCAASYICKTCTEYPVFTCAPGVQMQYVCRCCTQWDERWQMRWQSQQQGLERYNCADSLDRTNAASYFGAVQVHPTLAPPTLSRQSGCMVLECVVAFPCFSWMYASPGSCSCQQCGCWNKKHLDAGASRAGSESGTHH